MLSIPDSLRIDLVIHTLGSIGFGDNFLNLIIYVSKTTNSLINIEKQQLSNQIHCGMESYTLGRRMRGVFERFKGSRSTNEEVQIVHGNQRECK